MLPLVAAVALAAAPAAPARDTVVEQIVAVVRNPAGAPPRVVTLTKLTEEARVALVSRGATAAATGPLDREALGAALEWLIDQMLVADEAARLRIDEVPRPDVLDELRRFRARFASAAQYDRFLAANELAEEELLVTLARMVRVQRYVESRVGRAGRVGEDEVDRWLRERGATPAPGAARDAARAELVEERARVHVNELLAELRGRAQIRLLEPFGGPRAGTRGARRSHAPGEAVRAKGQPDEATPERAGTRGARRPHAPGEAVRAKGQPDEAAPERAGDRGARRLRAPRQDDGGEG